MVRLGGMGIGVSNYRHCKSFFARHALAVSEILSYIPWARRHAVVANMVFEDENEDDQTVCGQGRRAFPVSQAEGIGEHTMENRHEVFLLKD